MEGPGPHVVVGRAPNPVIAGMWAEALEREGIHAVIPGRFLADGWATWQTIIGALGCEISVPARDLARAREILDEIKPGADAMDFGEFDDDDDLPSSDGRSLPGTVADAF